MPIFRRYSSHVPPSRDKETPLKRRSTCHESYRIIRKLGEGGQGKTELCERMSDKKILVRKVQKDFAMVGNIPREMMIFQEILARHPSIVSFERANYMKADHSLVLYFEHCEGGDLSHYIPTTNRIPEDFIWRVFIQLADALTFLHYGVSRRNPNVVPAGWQRIVHRDVKPANVFLRRRLSSKNPIPDVVLGDFGIATMREWTDSGSGTSEWMPPEMPVATKQADVWGLGAIIHALAHGRGPVSAPPSNWPRGRKAIDAWYDSPKARRPKQMSTLYSDALNRNMMDCLRVDPKKRVTSKELLRNLQHDMPRHLC